AAFATHKVLCGDAAGFNLTRRDPRGRQGLQTVFAEGDRIAALSDAFHLAALAFAELHPLGHHWHKTPNTFESNASGACGPPASRLQLTPSTPQHSTGPDVRLEHLLLIIEHPAVDPAFHADRAVGCEGNRIAVVHVGLERRQGDRTL